MNIVTIKDSTFYQIVNQLQNPFLDIRKTGMKFSDLSKMTFNSFSVVAETTKSNNFVGMDYEFIDANYIPENVMPELVRDGKVIHFTNCFDKKLPTKELEDYLKEHTAKGYLTSKEKEEVFATISVYIKPQITEKNGERLLDLYMEPAPDCDDVFKTYSEDQKIVRMKYALLLLDHIESRLKKDRHRIKRYMPTPEQKESIEKEDKEVIYEPITIKDITVQYVYEPHIARKYQRHCEAWGVRGHYRQLKNGEIIYIKPYIKGKGKIKQTTYKFE